MSEGLKEQPWKGCVRLSCTAGSNPALSVVFASTFVTREAPGTCSLGLSPLWAGCPKTVPIASDRRMRAMTSSCVSRESVVRVFYASSIERANAQRNPAAVMRPARFCVFSNASGIIVSAIMARMAPAAMPVVAARTWGENASNML